MTHRRQFLRTANAAIAALATIRQIGFNTSCKSMTGLSNSSPRLVSPLGPMRRHSHHHIGTA